LQIAVGSYPGSNIRYLVHFRTDSTPKTSLTHELQTRICRLETIPNLLIETLANLEKEVEEGRFYHYTNTDTNAVISRRIQYIIDNTTGVERIF
jgi:hypothetical protein